MEMIDMGYKPPKGEGPVEVKSDKIHYPSLSMYDKVPETLMDKDVGEMCRIEIVGKIASKGVDENGDKKRENMTIEIHKMGYIGKGGKATKKEYLEMDDEKRNEYDKEEVGVEKEK